MKHTIYNSDNGRLKILTHYEQYLNSFDFEVERAFVDTSFGKTHVLMAGPKEGKPLFIFQGGNCVNPMTLSWLKPLIQKYRIYAPDTIGHPGYSEQKRISAKDDSFAQWIAELMDYFNIKKCAFLGPSYGAGIVLRLATYMPDRIDCAVLVSPAGLKLGSKMEMIQHILIPLLLFKNTSSAKYLEKITDRMSADCMKEMDRQIIGDIFRYVKLEQEMPKLTVRKELENYFSPTLIIAGEKDIFFPKKKIKRRAEQVIPNLTIFQSFNMGHFPSDDYLEKINNVIINFLNNYY
ncbi:alpha/beta hydrolase [Lysinibacillus agricola]|uniref:Alpha/beta hydrolase n=1 Tax=Lysinibacillus agricola TaxID=2590012 RepID=A0ABX7B2X7_9BACI|nr:MULTISPECIES: alpha/beta hydrolase [Lysinibacillus]KOS64377.1 alpha/beta hydrolase [Lysinibacillus sp. FJAT-14222]QQP14764.1 alpha/beta hydrolase [Lysinibacillus agricola]